MKGELFIALAEGRNERRIFIALAEGGNERRIVHRFG